MKASEKTAREPFPAFRQLTSREARRSSDKPLPQDPGDDTAGAAHPAGLP